MERERMEENYQKEIERQKTENEKFQKENEKFQRENEEMKKQLKLTTTASTLQVKLNNFKYN